MDINTSNAKAKELIEQKEKSLFNKASAPLLKSLSLKKKIDRQQR